ncbi:hypothetical protein N7478_007747 [Penicillium angulare]|uniref:uncharacterized protein n=1 Tax=Penicillium angulare TaxID=116970 RepID=UPI0025410AE3|nr:uncharacterized protein N7478_007747 [Penicillium angulare]KAJ5272622.1 hypothetical protein N7478_007747 [Penicillium angulare]
MEEHREGSIPLENVSRHSVVSSDETPIYHDHGRITPPEYYANEGSGSSTNHDEELPGYSQVRSTGQMVGRGHSARIHRSVWVSFGTILYVAMAVYAWAIMATLPFHPIKGKSWGYSLKNNLYEDRLKKFDYALDKHLYRSAQIVQAIVQVATLPWITVVCASAAVIYTQNQKNAMDLRLRNVMALADRRWNELSLYWSLAHGGWKRHGSTLLFIAIFVWFFGVITYPVQSIFLTSQSIKAQNGPSERALIFDFVDDEYSTYPPQTGVDVFSTRADLSKADGNAYQPNLWDNSGEATFKTLSEISSGNFYSQIPSGFNTGLVRQFAPRVNSTAGYETIDPIDFPTNCSIGTDHFYADYSSSYAYSGTSRIYKWGVIACMTSNSSNTPWNFTRNRQDFTETLYLNFTSSITDGGYDPTITLYRITVNTTAGYFELPNYLNNGIPGPLLDDGPTSLCDKHCMNQGYWDSYQVLKRRAEDTSNITALQNASWSSFDQTYKGPLLMTALATFGPGSFFEMFTAEFDVMQDDVSFGGNDETCLAIPPLFNILSTTSSDYVTNEGCLQGDGYYTLAGGVITQYIDVFTSQANRFPTAFTAAAYLANQNFMKQLPGALYVYQDLGVDINIPSISLAGVIVVSVLMALYLIPLLCLSIYAGRYPRWTSRLDSFVMLRFGAFAGDKVFPLLVTRNLDEVSELDEMPGVIRNVAVPSDDDVIKIGRLGFGEGAALQRDHRYESFKGDDENLTDWETRAMQGSIRRRN